MILPLSVIDSIPFASSIAGSASSSQCGSSGTTKASRLSATPAVATSSTDSVFGKLSDVDERSDAMIQRGIRRLVERASNRRSDSVEIRTDLVARVRAQIAAGEYDSPAKIEEAASRLVGHLDLLA
jgi:anti-sigma28 factor (negative regulator of flagellin synthesis)